MKWQSLGAPRLHLVDLDGAAAGELCHLRVIKEIASGLLIPTQLGGGIRQLETIAEILKAGVERVILGTAAVEDPELVKEACRKFQESIIVSLDAREGYLAIRGWRQETEIKVVEFAKSMVRLGVRRFIHTDISRDGTLTEPNFTSIAELIEAVKLPVIASGGVSSLDDIARLMTVEASGVTGVITGKAIYSGAIDLRVAVALTKGELN